MPKVELSNAGIVYRGQESEKHFRTAHHGTVTQGPNGDLVAAMDIASHMSAPDGRSYCCRSTDGGRTWSEPKLLFEPQQKQHAESTTCRISRAPNGQLIGFAGIFDRSLMTPHKNNPETGGTVSMTHAIVRSDDGGHTWSSPQVFQRPIDWDHFESCSVIIPVTEDRWLLPTATMLDWQGQCPFGHKAVVMISEDQGHTWPTMSTTFDFWSEHATAWEQKETVLSDGRLLAICWVYNLKTKENYPNRYTFSQDHGSTYDPALDSPLLGQTCTPLGLEDNHFVCVYRRLDQPGLWAHLAQIDGTQWRPLDDLCLWGKEVTALGGSSDSSLKHQHRLQFGFPCLIRMEGGDVFGVFWCVEDGLAMIRWFRLAVS